MMLFLETFKKEIIDGREVKKRELETVKKENIFYFKIEARSKGFCILVGDEQGKEKIVRSGLPSELFADALLKGMVSQLGIDVPIKRGEEHG